MQQLYIIHQKKQFRGPVLPPSRIHGKQYCFQWHAGLKVYAWKATSIEEANKLLKHLMITRVFSPGIALVEEAGALPIEQREVAPAALPLPVVPDPLLVEKRKPGRPKTRTDLPAEGTVLAP